MREMSTDDLAAMSDDAFRRLLEEKAAKTLDSLAAVSREERRRALEKLTELTDDLDDEGIGPE